MSIRDCLTSAAAQGAITPEEAQALMDMHDEQFAQARLAMGDAAALSKAKQAVAAELRATALEKRRQADLTEAARLTLKTRILDNTDGRGVFKTAEGILSHYGFRDGSSVRGRSEAIMATAHASMSEFMFAFRRSGLLGKRENRALHTDFAKELHGEHSGDATAKALTNGVAKVFEDLRQRFNAAGGSIGKLEGFGLPHSHDRLKVKGIGREPWKARMRELLDPSRMTDALTKAPISTPRFEAALDHAFDNITSAGTAHMTPNMQRSGLGAIGNRRIDERFFVFKDAAAWLDYHREFGRGDMVQAVVNHVNGMAKDIAAIEILGPNPAAMVEWLKQVVAREYGRKDAGLPSLAAEHVFLTESAGRHAERYIGWLWQTLRGNGTVVSGWANFTDSAKNLTTAALLGFTGVLAGVTDPFIARAGRKLAGLPLTAQAGAMLKNLSRQHRDEIVRSGVIWDEYLHAMGDEIRYSGPALGAEWTRWLADRATTWNGLKPLTTGRKLVEARLWQGHIADLAREGKTFDQLDPRLKRALDGFAINRDDWAIWTSAVDHNGFVTPMEILSQGGSVNYLNLNQVGALTPVGLAETKALRHREAAEKLAELTTSWSERSVPAGRPNDRAFINAGGERGTFPREMMEYFGQFKSFPMSFTAMQIEAMGEMASVKGGGKGFRTGLAYFAGIATPVTMAGAVYIQMKNLRDGRDPEDMTEPSFWVRALVTGGSFGLFGDFLKASENRYGQSFLGALAGPVPAFLGDAISVAWHGALGEEGSARDAAMNVANRWTPFLSSHPAVSTAYRRVVLDNLQWAIDPRADKRFKAKASKAKSDGSPYFLPPGTFTPSGGKMPARRLPDWQNAVGR